MAGLDAFRKLAKDLRTEGARPIVAASEGLCREMELLESEVAEFAERVQRYVATQVETTAKIREIRERILAATRNALAETRRVHKDVKPGGGRFKVSTG